MLRCALNFSPLAFGITVTGLILGMTNVAYGGVPVVRLPVQVYCYSFVATPELDCTMTRKDVESMMERVNGIWKQAGIHWSLLSVRNRRISKNDFNSLDDSEEKESLREQLITISPDDVDGRKVWKVVILHKSPVPAGGFYFAKTHTVYFFETTPRGKTKSVVLAHELGHSLGLAHKGDTSNLMHIGNPEGPKTLTKDQIIAVRTQAMRGSADISEMEVGSSGRATMQGKRNRRGKPDRKRIVRRLKRFDYDGDGVIHLGDVPAAGQRVFNYIDTNHDGKVDTLELNDFQYR